jgi:2,4-diketo-3-deoxy-L-fuconate hydrolase
VRLVTYAANGRTSVGAQTADGVVDLGYADLVSLIRSGTLGLEAARVSLETAAPVEGAQLVAPLRPGKILCCGINYGSHLDENPAAVLPKEPFFFSKLPSAVVGPDEPIVIPSDDITTDYEVELAMVIGRRSKHLRLESALDAVFGWTILNDVSARSIQFVDNQITLGKGIDTFSPIGPAVVTPDELGDPGSLNLWTTVNGETRQQGHTSEMLFTPAQILVRLTQLITLEPGDIVTTGTPAGVAAFMDPPAWLVPGDVVTCGVDMIGELTNPVTAAA